MLYIAHRGNVNGPNPVMENSPVYIDAAISEGYDVEIDLWGNGMELWLGHDEGVYPIDFRYLSERVRWLWIHCKNHQALHLMRTYAPELRYFWHQTDDYTLTSWHDVWCYPGKEPVGDRSFVVVQGQDSPPSHAAGVCSDYVAQLKHK